ncbi:hypothetical protein E8E13_008559 [Curvularia kusanoi]|uniref:Uncharacterized protein n=1 Tax=Curvularia kusanoi TaxID=90978 RepID=A0A9P4THG2_CURKU|nr:hypothetical protein E8E13_008559 [Curvularia kusanoi]
MARTMLILFVILGALSMIIAIIAFTLIRSRKKRSRAEAQARIENNINTPTTPPIDKIGVTTHISAETTDNPFLTASEKAILNRVSQSEIGGLNPSSQSTRFSDAVNLFIEKSRRLTYKISP